MKKILSACLTFSVFLMNAHALAQNKNAKVETIKLTDTIYRLVLNDIVNVIAFMGPDGVLLVDSGFDKNPYYGFVNSPAAVNGALKKLGNDRIKYIINTHTDLDHAYGNTELGKGATIIAQRLGRERLARTAQFPKEGLPNLTFDESLSLNFNNEEIDLFHLPGHTDHDIVIHFKKAKIVCVGDLIIPDSFGSISQTGNVQAMIKAMDALVDRFPDDVTFVAGHDRPMKRDEVTIYGNMIQSTLDIIVENINQGKSLEQMQKDDILKDWKNWNGVLFKELDADMWMAMIYMSVIKTLKPSAAEKVAELLRDTDGATDHSEIRSLLTRKTEYYFMEREFILLGYTLIEEGNVKAAIEVFKIAVELYPESWNAYDSLGEAYMKDGNKDLAVKNYRKSLQLKPDSRSGIDALAQLRAEK